MIIGKVKTNQPFMFSLLLIIAVVLWTDGFFLFGKTSLPTEDMAPFYSIIVHLLGPYKLAGTLISFFFMIIQAWMFNRALTDKNLVDRNSKLPALVYIVLMSSHFSLTGLQPVWFANFFLILALDKIFDVFRDEAVFIEIFNVGFLISLASLFYFPALVFILLIISALLIYYLTNIRAILASIMGFMLPWLFVALYFFWIDTLAEQMHAFTILNIERVLSSWPADYWGWIRLITTAITGLIAIASIYLGGLRDKPVRIRKRYQVILAYLLISLVALFFAGQLTTIHSGIILLPLAAIVAIFFQENRNNLLNEILFTILVLVAITGIILNFD